MESIALIASHYQHTRTKHSIKYLTTKIEFSVFDEKENYKIYNIIL